MTRDHLKTLLQDFKAGRIQDEDFLEALTITPFEMLGFATVDHHRALRQGFPEVIFCAGKTTQQVATIAETIVRQGHPLVATHASQRMYQAVKKKVSGAKYHRVARIITSGNPQSRRYQKVRGRIVVVSAGTSDIPVAEEAAITAEMMGNPVERLYDVGVAGIHRILSQSRKLRTASVVIVVAGMEGALPSVVGGLVGVPVIAVPTSIGYGASYRGLAALLAMLNSCAAGVLVVNVDNGFGAGYAASLINLPRV